MVFTKEKIPRIHASFDRLASRNRRILQLAIAKWFNLTIKQIRQDLTKKFAKDITSELTDWGFINRQGKEIIKPATLEIMQTGGQQAYKIMKIAGTFDVVNVPAIRAAEKLTADLVREITKGTKAGIRIYIKTGIKDGKSMPKIARELRPIVGLTKKQSVSVNNYRKLLEDKEKYPRLTSVDIDKRVLRYSNRVHRRRTETIARTETARAQNVGYIEGLKDAGVKQVEFSRYPGIEPPDECDELDGKKFDLNEAKDIIPVHPNCRCAMLPVVE